ncbi:MAG: flagellar biosynthetic protein FliO [Gemmataceae bacterium]|nr:flagellar biosynthetic protein FliO [Gemmataceae bacterium]
MTNPPTPARFQLPAWAVVLLAAIAVGAGLLVPGLLRSGEADQPDLQGRLTQLYGAAIAVLVLAVAALWLGRRWLGGPAPATGKQLAVLGGTAVGSRARIVIVRAMGQRLLAGIDASGLKLLLPVPDGLPDPTPDPGPEEPSWRT